MADSTLDSELIVLYDNWPGVATPPTVPDYSSMTSKAVGHNQPTAAYTPGTKWVVYNRPSGEATGVGQLGFATFIYLQLMNGTGAPVALEKQLCVNDSVTIWYQVSNDPDGVGIITTANVAVLLGPMADLNWGWFWCGGICPEQYVPALGGSFATVGNVVAGAISVSNLAADAMGLGACGADTVGIIGYALAADAA